MADNFAVSIPEGFTYLSEIDPSIKVALRYFSVNNFLGRPVDGYNNGKAAILTIEAAEALSSAQKILKKDGLGIVVYDAYRPQRAVDDFGEWSRDALDQKEKEAFYPRINKADAFKLGYLVARSSHSRGSTVDISIYELEKGMKEIVRSTRKLADGSQIIYLDDGSIDMGSSFDLFDEASHYDTNLITEVQRVRRNYLKQVMESCNFIFYAKEWWHFTLAHEPFPDTYHDFVVE